jgi:hypothetical protein
MKELIPVSRHKVALFLSLLEITGQGGIAAALAHSVTAVLNKTPLKEKESR